MIKVLTSIFAIAMTAQTAFAGECTLNFTREACPGKDKESYEKCDGKKSCPEVKKAKDAVECAAIALKACENVGPRQKVTKSKEITATFEGSPVEGGKNFCDAGRPDFNKCDK